MSRSTRTAARAELARANAEVRPDPAQRNRLSWSESLYLAASISQAVLAEPQIGSSGETCPSCGRLIDVLAHCRCSD